MQSPVLRLGLIINICTATALAKFAYMLPKVNANNTNNKNVAYVQNGYGWRFNCSTQISADAQFYHNRMNYVVTWTLDNAIWLKLDRGNAVIHRNLDEICQRRNGQTLTADILSNAHRYQFYYNEPDAQFWLEIINTTADDSGFWTCYVKISQRDGLAITETVTTVKLVVLDDKQMEQSDEAVNYEMENSFMTDYLLDEYDKNSFTETSADNSKAANSHAHTAFQFFCVMLSFSTTFIMNK
ncbi:P3N-PIPO polyprotein [Trichinella spiralis]|uniref:P3N-PIPO polyprotein n=1 Tax=Trichinella spiralis TaxID=6334 RepID=A0ABR3K481_TRISP